VSTGRDDPRSLATLRRALHDYIEEQARWRSEKASEYRGDRRNVASADALRELADYVGRLPESDGRLQVLAEMRDVLMPGGDVFMPGVEGSEMISRFGFDRQQPDWRAERAGEFLDALVAVCQREANDFRLQSLQDAAMTEEASRAMEDLDRAERASDDA
jgi:hypothetical protein